MSKASLRAIWPVLFYCGPILPSNKFKRFAISGINYIQQTIWIKDKQQQQQHSFCCRVTSFWVILALNSRKISQRFLYLIHKSSLRFDVWFAKLCAACVTDEPSNYSTTWFVCVSLACSWRRSCRACRRSWKALRMSWTNTLSRWRMPRRSWSRLRRRQQMWVMAANGRDHVTAQSLNLFWSIISLLIFISHSKYQYVCCGGILKI